MRHGNLLSPQHYRWGNITVMPDLRGKAKPLDVAFACAPSGGGLCILQKEEARRAYVVIAGYTPDIESSDRKEATALVIFTNVVQAVFGYPNDEAYEAEQSGLEGGIYEMLESTWASELRKYDAAILGPSHWFDVPGADPLRHYFVGSKDASCSVLARGIDIEVMSGRHFREVAENALSRL